MRKKSILIVEDAIDQIERYRDLVSEIYQVYLATNIREAEEILNLESINILLTDIHLKQSQSQNTYEGFNIIEFAKKHHPEVLVLVMSADPKIETYNQAFSLGARCFLKKPIINSAEIQIAIESAEQNRLIDRFKESNRITFPKNLNLKCEDGLVLPDKVRTAVRGVARVRDIPVVIYGETGTGKEEVAKLIHKRRVEVEGNIPFVAVNCANLKDTAALSLLFGHKKGSFTGASETTVGYIGEADGGILFLDEVHRLDEECQARLLRVLNDGTYQRFGDTKELYSRFQVVVASSRDLDVLVEEGKFLMDLRSRITGVDIELRPLRDRISDLNLLVPLYFAKNRIEVKGTEVIKIIEKCSEFYWQGNIRQLFNVLRSLEMQCLMNGSEIQASLLPLFRSMLDPSKSDLRGGHSDVDILRTLNEDVDYKESMNLFEKHYLRSLLSRHRTVTDAVKAVNISRSSLDLKIKKYSLVNKNLES
ncbi:sigma-54-dependent transcriptional regulator [Pseudobacteriovorax antillogorgiicola]|uniref:Two-component system, NtrC family, response regulator AtoC/two-component system, response regulator FlrC n=1 Tax=Pseudobacteriovorax antillogorgiicola TaxID=1513793 RepID=A0A1Y6BZJ8_9BACT|nr:sigma 54-interacting transcriptional regulator [Pseudobacteriovorax antillogorgiicola]TCS51184.1 two-component system response regulator AtoC/two-component system response regulator FlrC [Pseudobacteriovorax antillogorgiicola]SMF37836.1 two-component system, NtrC family, response regulator AtoC/two-component system, response regulator FlrC [Pseudobacteriovorax antillogorgiicola]